jgi:acetyl-CoA carboxylase carboxyltransferase component
MSLKQKTSDLKKRMRGALMGGGQEAIEKQKSVGKMTARERIIALLDPKSFHEYDLFVEHAAKDFDMDKKYLPGDGVITGTGRSMVIQYVSMRRLHRCWWFSGLDAFQEDLQDHGSCHETEGTTDWINDSGGARIQEGLTPWQVMVRYSTATPLLPGLFHRFL